MEVTPEFLQGVVAYVEKTNEFLEKAAGIDAEVAKRAPAVVDTLIKAGMLDADKRDIAITNVLDPLKTIESLRKTAEFIQKTPTAVKPPEMGSGAEMHKTAGSSDQRSVQKESDRIWESHFGSR